MELHTKKTRCQQRYREGARSLPLQLTSLCADEVLQADGARLRIKAGVRFPSVKSTKMVSVLEHFLDLKTLLQHK